MLMRILCTLVMASLAIGLTIGAATICYDIWAVAYDNRGYDLGSQVAP
jgi:hypothetical protein